MSSQLKLRKLNHRRARPGHYCRWFPDKSVSALSVLTHLKPNLPLMVPPELDNSALHVWFLNLDSRATLPVAACREWLDMEEQSRADRFSNSTSQCAFIKTRGHLRGLLGSYLGISPDKVGLTVNEHGKPRLSKTEENQGLVFNVSHSGNLAVLAFGLDTVIGVDVERIRVRGGLERLAEYALSAVELERWHRLPLEHRPEQFIRYWNIKEAFVKATGRGIVLGLNQVVVAEDFQGLQSVPPGFEPASDWVLHTGVMDDYRYALVYRKPERVIRLYDKGLDSLPSTVRNDS